MRRNSNLSITRPGSRLVSPTSSTRTLAQHLGDDDFDVLVVDFHALRTIHVLNFVQQVLLHRLFAADAQNVVRHERSANQRVARPDAVVGVHQQLLAVRNDVLDFGAVVAADDDDSLAALLLGDQFDFAVDLGDDGRVLRACGPRTVR